MLHIVKMTSGGKAIVSRVFTLNMKSIRKVHVHKMEILTQYLYVRWIDTIQIQYELTAGIEFGVKEIFQYRFVF